MTVTLTDRAKLAQDKARVLQEALPWMTRWTGRTVVVKYGGNALARTPPARSEGGGAEHRESSNALARTPPARSEGGGAEHRESSNALARTPPARSEGGGAEHRESSNALARTPPARSEGGGAEHRESSNALVPTGDARVEHPGEDPLFARDVALLHSVGVRVVVVHGGGPQISALADRLGLATSFVDGRRVTDAATLQAVQMALMGQVNPMLVRMIADAGAPAIGVSGTDAGLVTARQHDPRLGLVGVVDDVDPMLLTELLDSGRIPVMATLCRTADGQVVNVNADEVAGAVATALRADKLIYLTNVAGLYEYFGTPDSTLLSEVTIDRLQQMIDDDELVTGMIPKIASIVAAVQAGVPQAHLLDGRIEHALLLEIFTDSGIGTMITRGSTAAEGEERP